MKNTCETCCHYKRVYDRHGFDHGQYEDNSFCVPSQDPSFDEGLNDEELEAAKRGDLGYTFPCPFWSDGLY